LGVIHEVQHVKPASLFRETEEINFQSQDVFSLGYCLKCYLVQNLARPPGLFTPRSYDWIRYNEPDYHFPEVTSLLAALQHKGRRFDRVVGLSYKDTPLVEELSRAFGIPASVDDIIGVTPDWSADSPAKQVAQFEERLKQAINEECSVLIIARRAIEHCSRPRALFSCLGRVAKHVVVFFEDLGFKESMTRQKFDIIWNERTCYPFTEHLVTMIQSGGMKLLCSRTTDLLGEQLKYHVAANYSLPLTHTDRELVSSEATVLQYLEGWENLWKFWKRKLNTKNQRFGVVGASHKGISFSQLFLTKVPRYEILDDAKDKCGLYHPDKNIAIKRLDNVDMTKLTDVVFTVDLKWLESMRERLVGRQSDLRLLSFEGEAL